MTPFLRQTAQYLVSTFGENLDGICIVLPNRRGGLFLRRYLADEIGKATWSPAFYSIEDFIAEISGLHEAGMIQLMFELYVIHRELEGDRAQPFGEFIRWAPQLLGDFDEADRYLADPEELFTTLTEARAISLWNPDGRPLTDFEKRYLGFYRSMLSYYSALNSRLLSGNLAYQGLAFRQAAMVIGHKMAGLPWKHIVFAGFNALTRAEEKIIGALRDEGMATLLWDADRYYLENRQQEAGDFLRQWLKKWPVKEPRWISDCYVSSAKEIRIIGSPDPVGQVKYCGNLLTELSAKGMADERTAVVLLDGRLLFPLLNSIPPQVEALNVTAGLPLAQTPVAGLIETVFTLHLNAAGFTQTASGAGTGKFYFRDLLQLLQHPCFRSLARGTCGHRDYDLGEAVEGIRKGRRVFVGVEDLIPRESDLFSPDVTFLRVLLAPWALPADALACFRKLIGLLQVRLTDPVEAEYLFAFSRIFSQLDTAVSSYQPELPLNAFHDLYMQSVAGTSLPFYGEPLRGIQVMGMLETRTLDFENVIILSCNEDLLPGSRISASFIPYDIKRSFGLPTYRYKDSVYAYHFYRLIQRVKRAWILYSTEPEQLGGGDRSRFLRQMEDELARYNPGINISHSALASPLPAGTPQPAIRIEKTGDIIGLLEERAAKGFSATSLNAYRNCPLKFYYSEIAGIREPEEVGETIDTRLLGTAVHKALHELFKGCLDRPLNPGDLLEMDKAADAGIEQSFRSELRGGDISRGRNLLLVSVAKMMVRRLLQHEMARIGELSGAGQDCTVAFLEQYLETSVTIRFMGRDLSVRLKGLIDRVDRVGGTWRIIDYKTGYVNPRKLKVTDWDELIMMPGSEMAFQLLMYGYLLSSRFHEPFRSLAGILSLRKIGSGFMPLSLPGEEDKSSVTQIDGEAINRFGALVVSILSEIYDPGKPFLQTDDPEICRNCPYFNLCGR